MNTLNLQEAAAFLKIHPVTLGEKARLGIIPGTKIGKCWVFVDVDLIAYIRSQYKRQDLQGDQLAEYVERVSGIVETERVEVAANQLLLE